MCHIKETLSCILISSNIFAFLFITFPEKDVIFIFLRKLFKKIKRLYFFNTEYKCNTYTWRLNYKFQEINVKMYQIKLNKKAVGMSESISVTKHLVKQSAEYNEHLNRDKQTVCKRDYPLPIKCVIL